MLRMQQVLVRDVLVTHYETVQGRASVQRLSPVVVVNRNVRIVKEYGAIATNAFVLWCPRSAATATKSFVVIVGKADSPSGKISSSYKLLDFASMTIMSHTFHRLCRLFLLILIIHIESIHSLNLTYGQPLTEGIGFQSLEEYRSFLDANDLTFDANEPGYLVKCIAANKNKHAACLDGSPQTFYYRPGSIESANKFHIYLQGGGWCSGITTSIAPACADSCSYRASYSRGSSSQDPPYKYYHYNNYRSNGPNINPLSWDWNTIYVRYCDGASFSGNNDSEILREDGGDPIYFKGFNNLNAVLDMLRDEYGLLDATDVLLTGSSAGGLAVYLHADYIASYIGVKENNINFMAMADSGWFMDYEGNGQYSDCMKWIFEAQNTSIALNSKCLEKNGEGYKCMFAQHTTPFTESKLMAVQSRFDKWQTGNELLSNDSSEINKYGQQLEKSMMEQFLQSETEEAGNRMLYLDSCHHHGYDDEWKRIAIDGFNASQVQMDFWFDKTDGRNSFIQKGDYPCQDCCNSSKA